jgi:formate dehydrogenase subunit gamma
MMLIYFIRHNLPGRGDFKWLLTAGGLFTKKHLKNGFFNAGEKILYWATIIFGIVLSVTGLILLFPSFELTTNNSQLALIVHAVTALLLIALALAHILMSIKIEGTIEAMTKGSVDENWAKAHHSRWYEVQASNAKVSYTSSDENSHSHPSSDPKSVSG